MSNELIPASDLGTTDTKALATVAQGGNFLPRLQLFSGSSDACKEGKMQVGHHGLTRDKDTIEPLGKEVEVLILAGRTKAIEFGEQVLVFYEVDHPEFIRIQAEADAKIKNRMYGAEYLVWIPAAETFATYYLASPTARRASPSFAERLRKAAIVTSKLIDNGEHKWHGNVCKALEVPTFELPPVEEMKKQVQAFLGAKSSAVEKAAETAGERDR